MKTVLCYGDSNTWGTATRSGYDPRYDLHERWPGVLQNELGPSWAVIAEGLPGRTTVHPDPIEGPWLEGSAYLHPCLRSHRPLDVVAVMLGTNDLKHRFGVSAGDIARSIGRLLTIIAKSEAGPLGESPKMLVICPPPILKMEGDLAHWADLFSGGYEKSQHLAAAYAAIAEEHGAAFLNAGDVIRSSAFDGFHLDLESHRALGLAVASKLRELGW